MTVLSFISLYLSIGLIVSFVIVLLKHTLNRETPCFLVTLACTLFWPETVSSFIHSINN